MQSERVLAETIATNIKIHLDMKGIVQYGHKIYDELGIEEVFAE